MLRSGWAGAMGQPQFMPSVYLKSAVDFSGDGRRDIWHNTPDTLASIANYLAQRGVGARRELGRACDYGAPPLLAPGDQILTPDGAPADETYLVHPNFAVIKRYNPSDFYALTVGLLADAVA
jgi:membrane-bound lytic murein transglycosylase B